MSTRDAILESMNNLKPEVRTDKNGKATTRWVKSDSDSAASPLLPAPAVTHADVSVDTRSDEEILDSALKLLRSDVYATTTMHFNMHCLSKQAPDELKALEKELTEGTRQLRECWKQHLERRSMHPTGDDDKKDYLPVFRDTRTIVQIQAAITEHEAEKQDFVIHRSSAMFSFATHESGLEHLIPASLMAVWLRSGTPTDLTKDLQVLEFINDRYDEVMEHRYAIKERGSFDPSVMEAVIESEASSLSNGVL